MGASALGAIYEPLSEQTGLTLDQLNVGAGYSYFLLGLSTLILQPAALAFGKRPVYLLTMAGSAAITIWTAFVRGNSQWIAIKLLLGFLGGPAFSLVEVSIADYVSGTGGPGI
jgi:MFS family permease